MVDSEWSRSREQKQDWESIALNREERNEIKGGALLVFCLMSDARSNLWIMIDWFDWLEGCPYHPASMQKEITGFFSAIVEFPIPSFNLTQWKEGIVPFLPTLISVFISNLSDGHSAACLTVQLPTKCSIEGRVVQEPLCFKLSSPSWFIPISISKRLHL